MWSKFFRIPVLLLFLAITYYGCVEEPTIDPVKRPYTLLRVANFSYNVDTLIVSVDPGEAGAKVFNLYKNQVPTQYFEIQSGKRKFFVKNPAGDTLYNDKINIGSYEELSLYFSGYSKPHDDLLNTFGYAQFTNGMVYLDEGLNDTTTTIQCANFAPDTPTDSSIKYRVLIADTTTKNVIKEVATLNYNSLAGNALRGGKAYKISYAKLTSAADAAVKTYLFYSDTTYMFDAGLQYFVYGIGNPKKPNFIIEKITPLPIGSK
ncbi:MAG: hypothetical protein M0Q21_04495 [Ignavibacteriaceae bacterium]|nr:hypothetical protein [Ignavibacteriaceae bacterium]